MRSLAAALLLSPVVPPPPPTPDSRPVRAALRPLIGAPPFLKLHVVVEVGGRCFDKIPEEPKSLRGAVALLTGGSIEGRSRQRPADAEESRGGWVLLGYTTRSSPELDEFAATCPSELTLLRDDCWTHAARVARFALSEDDGG